jgi:hypothetical protein
MIETTTVYFRIDVTFDDCDVDMVFKEYVNKYPAFVPPMLTNGADIKIDRSKLSKTPIAETVNFAILWLAGYVDEEEMCTSPNYKSRTSELEDLGLEIDSWADFMMGNAHIIVSCERHMFTYKLTTRADEVVKNVIKRFVKYYSDED